MYKYSRDLSPEEKEERTQKQCEYYKNLSPEKKEKKRQKRNEYYKNLNSEEKEKRRQRNREYYRNLNPEKKKEMIQKNREYYENLSPEKKEEKNQKKREYYKNLNPEKKKEMIKKWPRCYKMISPEKKKEMIQKNCEYYKNLSPEKKEERRQRDREYQRKRRAKKMQKEIESYMKPQFFCYVCRVSFVNNSVLLEHLAAHISLPTVVLSRIDTNRVRHTIKKESEDTQINCNLPSDMTQNVFRVKTEVIEYDEDIEQEFNNTHIDTENDTEIEIDDVSFYTRLKKEMQDDCTIFL